ncbi:MAG: class I tRNA ligase family protein, partial [Pseudomonadales bacterium]|nr:class I tRNA ligase family protein [Pseudomonadales bacterium]
EELEKALHKLIKKVGEDIEVMKFNTAISAMMEFVNSAFKTGKISLCQAKRFVLVLAPLAPHICEELWQLLGNENTLAYETCPAFDENMLVEDSIEMPVQINGKVRGRVTVSVSATQDEILKLALAAGPIAPQVEGKNVVKTIVIPGKMVNIVVK